ncbi:MAG: pyruvate kinase [Fimbriimonadaceae bacterium]|nr:pyruvate kinase [Chthonomonadaceae bacterium]MCO5296750.1 pyruvate kinase [Fimbriimonadaceae bacterium]
MKRCTKIVCTLGPAVDSRRKIAALIRAGMNVARINCSHGNWDQRRRWVGWIRELSPDIAPIAILVDLQGPKFRIGAIRDGEMAVKSGQSLTVGLGDAAIPIVQPEILDKMAPGDRLLLGDGEVELRLQRGGQGRFDARVASGGTIKSRRGVTLVGKVFSVPPLTSKDLEDIREGCGCGADFIALSYVHSGDDMRLLRKEVDRYDPEIRLCAKIETRAALQHLDAILDASDLVMVARGDLGLQMDLEDVPLAQKQIIEQSTRAGRPVITATQMLESMVHAARPTRAEATDVANAVLDGTDALMLSGETATGEYPLEAVRVMARIAKKTEGTCKTRMFHAGWYDPKEKAASTDAIARAVRELAVTLKPRAILTTTTSGQTARLVSRFRPPVPILCATWNAKTLTQMAVVWGVEALGVPLPQSTDEIIEKSIDAFVLRRRLKYGDLVVITAGVPAGIPGHTNLILTQVVQEP